MRNESSERKAEFTRMFLALYAHDQDDREQAVMGLEQAFKAREDYINSLSHSEYLAYKARREAQALEEEPQLTCEPECDMDNAVPYRSTGALGHGWECGICGNFLQAG